MYCPTCGVAVTQSLSYCNFCGAKLTVAKADSVRKSPEVKPELLVSAMVVVFVFGLGAITLLMGMMKAVLNLNLGLILGFTLLSFLILLSIESVLMRLLFRRRRGHEEPGDAAQGQPTRELDAAQARALPEPRDSVTEHTTRAFEPIYNPRSK